MAKWKKRCVDYDYYWKDAIPEAKIYFHKGVRREHCPYIYEVNLEKGFSTLKEAKEFDEALLVFLRKYREEH